MASLYITRSLHLWNDNMGTLKRMINGSFMSPTVTWVFFYLSPGCADKKQWLLFLPHCFFFLKGPHGAAIDSTAKRMHIHVSNMISQMEPVAAPQGALKRRKWHWKTGSHCFFLSILVGRRKVVVWVWETQNSHWMPDSKSSCHHLTKTNIS